MPIAKRWCRCGLRPAPHKVGRHTLRRHRLECEREGVDYYKWMNPDELEMIPDVAALVEADIAARPAREESASPNHDDVMDDRQQREDSVHLDWDGLMDHDGAVDGHDEQGQPDVDIHHHPDDGPVEDESEDEAPEGQNNGHVEDHVLPDYRGNIGLAMNHQIEPLQLDLGLWNYMLPRPILPAIPPLQLGQPQIGVARLHEMAPERLPSPRGMTPRDPTPHPSPSPRRSEEPACRPEPEYISVEPQSQAGCESEAESDIGQAHNSPEPGYMSVDTDSRAESENEAGNNRAQARHSSQHSEPANNGSQMLLDDDVGSIERLPSVDRSSVHARSEVDEEDYETNDEDELDDEPEALSENNDPVDFMDAEGLFRSPAPSDCGADSNSEDMEVDGSHVTDGNVNTDPSVQAAEDGDPDQYRSEGEPSDAERLRDRESVGGDGGGGDSSSSSSSDSDSDRGSGGGSPVPPDGDGDSEDSDEEGEGDRGDPWRRLLGEFLERMDVDDLIRGQGVPTPRGLACALELARWKCHFNISGRAFDALSRIMGQYTEMLSSRQTLRRLKRHVGWSPVVIDCCPKSHAAYTGIHTRARRCPREGCNERRYRDVQPEDEEWPLAFRGDAAVATDAYPTPLQANGQPRISRKSYLYIPLIPRLLVQYSNAERARVLKSYRAGVEQAYQQRAGRGPQHQYVSDVWDAGMFRQYLQQHQGLFQDEHDLAVAMFVDGVSVLKRPNKHSVWVCLLQLLNLPPAIRFHRENLLLSFIVPGPSEPTEDVTTWVYPLLRELEKLGSHGRVRARDGDTLQYFTLRTHLVLALGDQIAINLVTRMKGHNSRLGCRQCKIHGVRHGTIYYYEHTQFYVNGALDLAALHAIRRTRVAEHIENLMAEGAPAEALRGTGYSGRSPFLDVADQSLHFVRGVPYAMMHVLMINIIELLFKLLRGEMTFDQGPWQVDSEDEDEDWQPPDYVLSDETWAEIGAEMEECAPNIPLALGRAPLNIHTRHTQFKAVGWWLWLQLYAVPLLTGRLPARYIDNLMELVRGFELALAWKLTPADIDEVQRRMASFVAGYEQLYRHYDENPARIKLMTTNIHALLHLHQQLRDWGPLYVTMELFGERVNGLLIPKVLSQKELDESIAQEMIREEYTKSVAYMFEDLNLFNEAERIRVAALHGGYACDYGTLVGRTVEEDLTAQQHRPLVHYLRDLAGRPNQVAVANVPLRVIKRPKYKIDEGHMCGSALSLTGQRHQRNNAWVRYQPEERNAPEQFLYGEVLFYCVLRCADVRRSNRPPNAADEGNDPFEHHLAALRYYRTDQLDLEEGNRRITLGQAGAVRFVALHSIDTTVGRLTTHAGPRGGRTEWIITDSLRPFYNPAVVDF